MDIRVITPAYAVSPQIDPADMAAIKAAGYVAVIANRPDDENPPERQIAAMAEAAKAAGLGFYVNQVTAATINSDTVKVQYDAMAAAGGPVLAYCASGNRSSILWALGQAGKMPTAEIIATTAKHGYDHSALAPRIDALIG